jgi:hypothetical protein
MATKPRLINQTQYQQLASDLASNNRALFDVHLISTPAVPLRS